MIIDKNKVVELSYTLDVDGEIMEVVSSERPLDFIFGTQSLIPKFEANIEGLKVEDEFSFVLEPSEAHGEIDPNKVIELPWEAFSVNGEIDKTKITVGTSIPLMSNTGHVEPAIVVEVGENFVTMDLNSPMAGKKLNFSGKILSIREATETELKDGLHGELVHSNGGCGCGCGCHGEDHEHEDGCCGGHGDGNGEGCCGEGNGEGCCCGHKHE